MLWFTVSSLFLFLFLHIYILKIPIVCSDLLISSIATVNASDVHLFILTKQGISHCE